MSLVRIRNTTKGASLGDSIEVADTARKRNVGLLRHSHLADGSGLWIPTSAVHTVGMKFSIDLVWLDRRHRVTKVVHALKPLRLSGSWRAHSVVELPAGKAAETGTERGDAMEVERLEADPGAG